MYVADKNYYPKTYTGHTLVASVASGDDTLETHEFYNAAGLVEFYWKVKKNSDGDVIDFRLKIPSAPAEASVTYVSYDDLT